MLLQHIVYKYNNMKNTLVVINTILFLLFNSKVYAHHIDKDSFSKKTISIPKILSVSDLSLYKKVIRFQSLGKWSDSQSTFKKINNNLLEGYIEYDKLMHPNKYRASYLELENWLNKYNDYPAVMKRRVFRLMQRRAQSDFQRKKNNYPKYGNYLRGYGEVAYYKNNNLKIVKGFNQKLEKNEIRKIITEKNAKKISSLLKKDIRFQELRVHFIKPMIDKTYFSGSINESFKLYKSVISSLSYSDPELLFRAGINAFRLGKISYAHKYFLECVNFNFASNSFTNDWLASSCSYWLARLKNEKKSKLALLRKASKYPRTLYGQLASEKLNIRNNFIWNYSSDHNINEYKKIVNSFSFRRMIALTQLSLYNKADLELRNLYSKLGQEYIEPLYFLSEKLDLAAAQMRLGSKFYNLNRTIYMRGLYPTPEWDLTSGYILDKALLFALIRRESAFNIKAKSSKGARGLMQLMPRTASKIKKDYTLRYSNVHQLYSLQLNLELGQKFLKNLIHSNPKTNNSLLDALIAYNAGIGRLKNWKKDFRVDDPLLFIESIPIKETRWFVKYILTDLWIYRDKMQQEKPTRALLAKEKWPKYKNIDFIFSRDAKVR